MDEYFSFIYKEAVKRGYALSYQIFIQTELVPTIRVGIPQVDETLDTRFVTQGVTFGTDEPSYAELIGQEEILRIRTMKETKFLLLGSLGVYSAREFRNFAKKISSKIESHVVDIDPVSVQKITQEWGSSDNVWEADARKLPFKNGSIDYVFTNRLFHDLVRRSGNKDDVSVVLKEVSRVLKRGGSFIIAEELYGDFLAQRNGEGMKKEFAFIAEQNGFRIEKILDDLLEFPFTKERSSMKFNKNGTPDYGTGFVIKNVPGMTYGAKFTKGL